MDFRLPAIFALVALLLASGCRQNAAQREVVERELRWQEDRIYELEAQLEDARRSLERGGTTGTACPPSSSGISNLLNRSNSSPTYRDELRESNSRPNVSPGSSSGGSSSGSPSLGGSAENDFAPRVELPPMPTGGAAPPARSVPVISPPDANRPEGLPGRGTIPMPPATETTPLPMPMNLTVPMPGATSGDPAASPSSRFAAPAKPPESVPFRTMSSPKFRSPNARSGTPAPAATPPGEASIRALLPGNNPPAGAPAPQPPPADLNIAAVTLHRRTGGWNADGKPGDEGVTVVVEPRNARGQLVPAAGAVSIALIDPAIPGDGGRYARLDFTADDAQAMQRSSNVSGNGEMQIDVPWPDAPPAHAKLRIFVRLTTDDGRKLQADREVTVDLRGTTRQALSAPGDPREPGMLPAADSSAESTTLFVPPPPIPQGEMVVGPVLMGPTLIAPAEVPPAGSLQPGMPAEAVPATADGTPGAWKRR
jgi:hypothetical protein